jgi:hypothetical protein
MLIALLCWPLIFVGWYPALLWCLSCLGTGGLLWFRWLQVIGEVHFALDVARYREGLSHSELNLA